jgi:hypothetical protein
MFLHWSMTHQLQFLVSLLSVVVVSSAAPLPQYTVHFPLPASLQATSSSIIPSGPPVVLQTGTAFVAYYDVFSSPLTSALVAYETRYSGPPAGPPPTPDAGVVIQTATGSMISSLTPGGSGNLLAVAVVQMDDPSDSGAAIVEWNDVSVGGAVNVAQCWSVDRLNSTYNKLLAIPELSMIIFAALLPTAGPPPYPQSMEIVAVSTNCTTPASKPVIIWNHTWVEPITPANGAPLYYDGMIYFFHGDRLYRVNARTGFTSGIFANPCKQNASAAAVWSFGIPSFDVDPSSGQSLDAFILYANTTNTTTTVCRFSHTTGNTEWSIFYAGIYIFDDFYGGGGNVYLTGRRIDVSTGLTVQYVTWVHNATNGAFKEFPLARNIQDVRSYPRLLPSYMNSASGCLYGPVMIQQSLGSTFAYCATEPGALLWSAQSVPCYHTPLVVSPILQPDFTFIGCTDFIGGTVSLLSATSGNVVWTYPIEIGMSLATDHAFVYAVNKHGVLVQLGIQPAVPTQGNGGGGLSSGDKAAVAIVVLISVAAIVAAVVRYYRGSGKVRRQAAGGHQSLVNEEEVVVPSREFHHGSSSGSVAGQKGAEYGALD